MINEAKYIKMFYGTCRTMDEAPKHRHCECMRQKLEPQEQIKCKNWESLSYKSYKEMLKGL